MHRASKRDPIAEAHRQWTEHGWAPSADGMAAVSSVMRAHQLFNGAVGDALAPYGLTFARYELLALLCFTKQRELPLTKVGTRLQVHQTSVTNLVSRLEEQGYVERVPHPTDRRSTFARITPAGEQVIQRATPRLNDVFASLPMVADSLRRLVFILADLRGAWGDFEPEPGVAYWRQS